MLTSYNPLELLALKLSNDLGFSPPSFRILITTMLGYPIALLYLLYIKKFSSFAAHVWFFMIGFSLSYWNFGFEISHLLIGIFITFSILNIIGPTNLSIILTFSFNMMYLLIGYYFYNHGEYDINWTMSYCVLCLRLIGLAWDYRDGSLPKESLSLYQKSSSFKTLPNPIEMLSFCFAPTACFAGPQFTWRHYESFVNQTLRPSIILKNRSIWQKSIFNPKFHRSITRFLMGVVCMNLHIYVSNYFPMDYMLTDEFLTQTNVFYRIGYTIIYSQFLIMRYLSIWLFGEGACVLLGLGCTGQIEVTRRKKKELSTNPANNISLVTKPDVRSSAVLSSCYSPDNYDMNELEQAVASGEVTVKEKAHTKCANISIVRFQLATNTDQLVSSFNINTNKWMLEYIYKRLKFLGNKHLSQLITLSFLAIWHGFYSGYFVNFFLELIITISEKELLSIVRKSIYSEFFYETFRGKVLSFVIGKLHVWFLLATPLVAFSLLRFSHWYPVLSSTYFVGMVYILWPLAKPFAKKLFPPQPQTVSIHQSDKKCQ